MKCILDWISIDASLLSSTNMIPIVNKESIYIGHSSQVYLLVKHNGYWNLVDRLHFPIHFSNLNNSPSFKNKTVRYIYCNGFK